ncbi:MAG: UMP kinase [Chlorobi bacterium]|nr:UMP kinase [Chlorobiota bacterium]
MKYSRILLKLSGEALQGDFHAGIDPSQLLTYVKQVGELVKTGVSAGIVIGGGNFFRGIQETSHAIDRVTGDRIGMLATIMNGLALQSAFNEKNIPCRLFTAMAVESIGERFNKEKVITALNSGKVALFAGGTGNPFFTTDTAAALRALETGAQVLLKGTRVDGVYDDDPEKNPDAVKYTKLTFDEAYQKGLKIMDLTAFTLCRENNLPVIVFNMNIEGNLLKAVNGDTGTLVYNDRRTNR